ncbi:hypothetical protein CJ030_MR8G002384 [Morella rubra]|uniref:DUF4378 domain-containing protein n=1 Tax=Morella rubra TaxID=262757 RepID=A0A6A1UQQ7_9ROSI|nr:hypothetical protein CJ030_MR8G002384 [Morella rubra]
MEVEKRRSKGRFLNLFDWNGKSRKKLFSNNSHLPEGLNQGKENAANESKLWLNTVEVDDNGASSSNTRSGDYNCASSVTDDEGGAKAPGVVARLMGLDMLPASTVTELCSTPCFYSRSFGPSLKDRSNPNLWSDHHLMDFMNRDRMESGTQKQQNRPFERFQTEMLPPKWAKSMPITHHRLLSPIKSREFVPSKNAAYIMEAAAKIIDASPQPSTKNKVSPLGSPSVPLRIKDLKEKMEAGRKASRSERLKEPSAVRCKRGQSNGGSCRGSEYISESKYFTHSEKSGSDSLSSKGKSVSLAVQAKVNIKRKNGSTSNINRTFMNQKTKNDEKSSQFCDNRPIRQRVGQKRTSANRTVNVLRQNNQKQNCVPNKESSSSKASVSNQLARRTRSTAGSVGPNKTVNKVVNSETGATRLSSVATHTGKEFPLPKTTKSSQKKISVSGEVHLQKNVINDVQLNNYESSRKGDVAMDGCMTWGADDNKQGMDVISFTFTSPLRRSIPEALPSSQLTAINNHFSDDSFGDSEQPLPSTFKLSSPTLNVIGGDTLSVLLEQKLQELTHRVDSSHCNLVREGTSASVVSGLHDLDPSVASPTSREQNRRFQFGLHRHELDCVRDFDCSSVDDLAQSVDQRTQESEWVEENSSCSNNSAAEEEIDFLGPRSASGFEQAFGSDSVPDNSQNTNGSTKYVLEQVQESSKWHSTSELLQVGGEMELYDVASSMSTGDASRKHLSRTFSLKGFMGSSNRELEYVKDILNSAELTLEDFALGQISEVAAPNLFDPLEILGNGTERNGEECFKLGRKVLFDCVSECLDLRSRKILVGSCKSWSKWVTLSGRKLWLAEDVYEEILGWKSMEDLMLDEIVDKDMSTQYGRWIDFDIEAFEEVVDMEKGIVASLVDELISDILYF